MRRSLVIGLSVAAVAGLVAAGVLALTPPGGEHDAVAAESADNETDDPPESAPAGLPSGSGKAGTLPRGMLTAMQTDLGLSETAATAQVAAEQQAYAVDTSLRGSLADDYAGAHFDAQTGTLVVAITDPDRADDVLAAGADYEVVDTGLEQLDQLMSDLDDLAHGYVDLSGINGWYVDPTSDSVVVSVDPTRMSAAGENFVAAAQNLGPAIQTRTDDEAPRLFSGNTVVGGDSYVIADSVRCSVGFAVQGGFVSAGHCGRPNQPTSSAEGVPQGVFLASSFPHDDYSVVTTNSSWSLAPAVMDYNGGQVAVSGSQPALIGSSVCRSGSTSGWHCGTIQARYQTVVYPEGIVSGLTRTDVCAEPGDSGGPFVSGDQAQGMTSGGTGDCQTGGTTYFQPIGEVLNRYHLTLLTG